jgi:Domain of unknown function (DUF4878)
MTGLVGILVAILWACGGAGNAKEVGEKFLIAYAQGDITTAKKYATREAQQTMDLVFGSASILKTNPDKIKIGQLQQDGDMATLAYNENGTDKTLSLRKEDGEWKVAWSKDSLEGMRDDRDESM